MLHVLVQFARNYSNEITKKSKPSIFSYRHFAGFSQAVSVGLVLNVYRWTLFFTLWKT